MVAPLQSRDWSHRSLEGVLDELRSDRIVDGISKDTVQYEGTSDPEEEGLVTESDLPGAGRGRGGNSAAKSDGSRITRQDIRTTAIRFSGSGREWAAATTQGLQVSGSTK